MWWRAILDLFFPKKQDEELICKAILNTNGTVRYESTMINGSSLQEIIDDDKRYGVMHPKNGKYFTYKVMDWQGKWITNEQIIQGITLVWNKVEKVLDLEFREAKHGEYADFKIYFRTVSDDPKLSKNTLQYQYYPIADYNNPNRGVCVVNADYPWNRSGKGIPLHEFDPDHYPEPTTSTAETIDFDAVYEHEGPGHGLGLPHSPNRNSKMYWNYNGMAESIFDEIPPETITRWRAKYDKAPISDHELKRWIEWFNVAQDRES